MSMNSVNTNTGAMVALQYLNQTAGALGVRSEAHFDGLPGRRRDG